MQRGFTNVLCADVARTSAFYEELLGLTRRGDFGWFVLLSHDDLPGLEFGLLDRAHATVPPAIATAPAGVILTFVVADVEACYEKAKALQATVIEPPTDMPYGQRRLLLRDPEGATIDISAPVA